MCEKFRQLLAVGRWFPPGTPVSFTRKLISSSSFHRLDMTLAVAEVINPDKPNQTQNVSALNYLFGGFIFMQIKNSTKIYQLS